MAYTSGSTAFNLDFTELVEEAYERCGLQSRSGYDLRTARRSMNLMAVEWANRGINLWTVEECVVTLSPGQAFYPVPVDTVDILDLVTRTSNASTTNQQDINLSRISESTYSTIPNKLTYGRPIQAWFNRQSGNANPTAYTLASAVAITDTVINLNSTKNLRSSGYVQIDNEIIGYANISGNALYNCYRGQNGTTATTHSIGASVTNQYLPNIVVWPTPDAGGGPYTLVYWRMRRLQDAGDGVNIADIPFRFINCFVAGLAAMLSVKIQGTDPNRVLFLQQEYEKQFDLAAAEDRETAPIRWVPRNLFYAR